MDAYEALKETFDDLFQQAVEEGCYTEDEYARMRSLERQGQLQIRRHAAIIEGHILPDKPKKRRH